VIDGRVLLWWVRIPLLVSVGFDLLFTAFFFAADELWLAVAFVGAACLMSAFAYVANALATPPRRLSSPPGWNLRSFGEVFFSKKTFTVILEPALSDMQKEHFKALAAGRLWKARMELVRGYWSFWSAVLAQLPISFARRVYEVWKATKAGS
jgi:hypothetical protein